jgi:hypothetical protein
VIDIGISTCESERLAVLPKPVTQDSNARDNALDSLSAQANQTKPYKAVSQERNKRMAGSAAKLAERQHKEKTAWLACKQKAEETLGEPRQENLSFKFSAELMQLGKGCVRSFYYKTSPFCSLPFSFVKVLGINLFIRVCNDHSFLHF